MQLLLRARVRRPWISHTRGASRPSLVAQCTQRNRSDNTSPSPDPEAPPFHGYLIDQLDAPLHSIVPATSTTPAQPPADELPKTDEEEKLIKARVVFGSRLAGPAERKREIEKASTDVAGIMVPPRPDEPDNCCMSGCVNCVWDVYRDELEEWAAKSAEARAKLVGQRQRGQGTGMMVKGEELPGHVATSMDDDGGGSEAKWDLGMGEGKDLFEGIPVGIREFMRTEKKLKERHRREGSVAG